MRGSERAGLAKSGLPWAVKTCLRSLYQVRTNISHDKAILIECNAYPLAVVYWAKLEYSATGLSASSMFHSRSLRKIIS